MASTVQTHDSQQYVDFDEYIDYQLQKTRGNIKSTDILTAFACIAAFVLAYLLLFVVSDHWLVTDGFSQTARVVLLSVVGLLSAGWFAWKVVWPYLRQVNGLFAAKVIETSQPELRSTLLNLIDARAAGRNVSPAILSAMEKRAAISMSHANVDEAVDRRPLLRACYAVLVLVVVFSLYTLFTPKKVSTSIWRALFPTSAAQAPTQTVIGKISPGDVQVIPGTRLEVLADISGEVPEKVVLRYSTADREFVDEPIEMRELPDMPRRYRAEIIGANGEGIQQDLNYDITAGDDRSAKYAVTVFQPPSAEIVELQYTYPAYMDREAKTRTSGNIDDYEGVSVTFIADGNMPLKSATITFHDDQGTDFRAEALPMSPLNTERTRFRATWQLNIPPDDGLYPHYYTIECKNKRGDSDPNPTRWPIRIHPDQRPEVLIVNPGERELKRPANAILPLTAAARDDFKVQKLILWKQLNDNPPVEHEILYEGADASLSVDYDWRLNEGWELKTGDMITYWVEAHDNRAPEPGRRNSDKHTIRIEPQQPEKAIQEQLEQDRRLQEPDPENNDPSKKNADDFPQKNPPRPEEQVGEQENQNPQQQPMQEEQPQQDGGGNSGNRGEGEGKASDKTDDEGESSQTGEGQRVKNDGTQDGKALESLHQHYDHNKSEPAGKNSNNNSKARPADPKTGEQKNDPANDAGRQKPSGSEPNQNPGDPSQENQQGQPKKPEETNPQSPENPGQTSEKNKQPGKTQNAEPKENPGDPDEEGMKKEADPNEKPMPAGSEKTEEANNPPDNNTPGEKTEKTESNPNQRKTPDGSQTPENQKKPGEQESKGSNEKNPAGQDAEGGSDNNTGQGKPANSSKPSASKPGESKGGEDTNPRDGGQGRQSENPIKGNESPAEPDPGAEKRKANGEETGPGTAENDPNADPTRAKNPIDRKDPENPTTTKKREGDPDDLTPEEKNAAKPSDPRESKNPETGDKKPNPADPADKTTKPGTNPDQKTARPSKADPDQKPARQDRRPDGSNEEVKAPRPPEQEPAQKPEAGGDGEGGMEKQNQQGTPGGNEKGPGDRTKCPGETEPAEQPNGGKPSSEAGKGSRTRPTEKTENAPPRQGGPQDQDNPQKQDKPNASQPNPQGSKAEQQAPAGEPAGSQTPGQRNGEAGTAGDFGPNRPSTQSQPTPQSAEAAEKANLEFGRKAADLTLKRLEDQLRRGEVDEEWLKEMGWDKADASQFLDRMKDRLNQRDQDTAEALARQRQFNEWLKRLNNPTTKTSRRDGSGVRNRGPRDLFDAKDFAPPPELRDLYDAYQKGISERTK